MENKTIKRSYSMDMEGNKLYGEYPSHLDWDGQKEGMDYMDGVHTLEKEILMGILIKQKDKEITMEEGNNLLWELTWIMDGININLAWYSDGEISDKTGKDKYLMEAFTERENGNGLKDLQELYNKVYPK